MGFLDNVQSAVNRGTAAAQRTGRTSQLKSQMNALVKQRRDLAAQLGASLYDVVKDNPEYRVGREPLFDGIKQIDEQRAAIEAEIARIEEEAAAQQVANTLYKCPRCGATVGGSDLFCSGCGAPVAEIKATSPSQQPSVTPKAEGPVCSSCGAPVGEGDLFCMSCGAKVEIANEPIVAASASESLAELEPVAISEQEPVVVSEPESAAISEPEPVAGNPVVDSGLESTPAIAYESAQADPEPHEPLTQNEHASIAEANAPTELPADGFCAHCGNRLEQGDAFCAICGSPTA